MQLLNLQVVLAIALIISIFCCIIRQLIIKEQKEAFRCTRLRLSYLKFSYYYNIILYNNALT